MKQRYLIYCYHLAQASLFLACIIYLTLTASLERINKFASRTKMLADSQKKQNQQTLVVLAATAVLTALAIISTNTNAASSRD